MEFQWNNYSTKFAPVALKKNEHRRYRVLGSENFLQGLLQLPNECDIEDPETGETIKIGPIKKLRVGKDPELYPIDLDEHDQQCFLLRGNKREDREIDKFLQRASYNKSNPFNVDSDPADFKIEVLDPEAKVLRDADELMRKDAAVQLLKLLSEAELREFMNDHKNHEKVVYMEARKVAQSNPGLIEDFAKNKKDVDLKEVVQKAEKEKLITFDKATTSWLKDGKVLFSYQQKPGVGKFQKFIDWSKTDEGKSLMDELIKEITNS
jgi:hypothetical protein